MTVNTLAARARGARRAPAPQARESRKPRNLAKRVTVE
jgi:hypothetical protein